MQAYWQKDCHCWVISMAKIYGKDMARSFVELLGFSLVLSLVDLLLGEPEDPHLYDFGICGRALEPPNHFFLFLETAGYLKTNREKESVLKNLIFRNTKMLERPKVEHVGKNGRRKSPTTRLINS